MEFQNFCLGVRMLITGTCSKEMAWGLLKKAIPADAVRGCFLHEHMEAWEQGTVLTALVSGMDFAKALSIHRGIVTNPALLPYLVQEKPVLDLNECQELDGVVDLGPVQEDDGFCGMSSYQKPVTLVLLIDAGGDRNAYRELLKEAADAVDASGYRIQLHAMEVPCTGAAMAETMFRMLEGHCEKKRITLEDGTTEQIMLRRLFDRSVVLSGSAESIGGELTVFANSGETKFVLGVPSKEKLLIPEQVKTIVFEDGSCERKEKLFEAGLSRLFRDAAALFYIVNRCGSPRSDAVRALAEEAGIPFFQAEKDCSGLLKTRQMKKALHVK